MQKPLKKGWRKVKLKEVCREITVGHVGSMAKEYVDEGIPFLRSQNILPFSLELSSVKYITPEFHAKLKKSALLPGDVAVVRTGYPGTACVIPSKLSICNCADLVIIRPSEEVNAKYLTCIFNSTWGQGTIAGTLVGVAQQHFNVSAAKEMEVNLPPRHTQDKIAAILSAYDDLIENNTRRIEILEEMARSIFREWFVKFRFPGHEQVQMVDSELGPIPEGWEVKHLPDICSKVIDGTHDSPKPVNEGYYLVTGKHIVNGFIDFSKCYFISHEEHEKVMKRSKPEKGDTIFSNIGTLGCTAIVEDNFEFSIKNVALFKPLEEIHSCFIYLYFSSPETLETMEKKASGTSQRFFSLKFLRELDLVVPPNVVFCKFNSFVRPILEERSLLNKKNHNLRQTRELLLPRLISGEIDVENLDINSGPIAA